MLQGFGPIDLLFPQLVFSNPIFGPELLKEIGFTERVSILECSLIMLANFQIRKPKWKDQ
jgi:hypothetical protein